MLRKAEPQDLIRMLEQIPGQLIVDNTWPELSSIQNWIKLNLELTGTICWIAVENLLVRNIVYFFHNNELWLVESKFIDDIYWLSPHYPNGDD